jgi:outer membrane protein TolC
MKHGLNEGIGVGVSIPIFDANSSKRAVAEAKLNALNYELDQESLLNNLSQTIESLYIESRSARAKYVSGKTQLEAAELTDQLVNRQFELGDVNPVELLTAHNNLLNARLELLQSKYMAILSNKTIEYYANQTVSLDGK